MHPAAGDDVGKYFIIRMCKQIEQGGQPVWIAVIISDSRKWFLTDISNYVTWLGFDVSFFGFFAAVGAVQILLRSRIFGRLERLWKLDRINANGTNDIKFARA